MPTPQDNSIETVDALVRRSQECVRSADYDGALDALRRALDQAPTDEHLRGLFERTRKAAERHAAAVGRQRAVRLEAQEIRAMLDGDGERAVAAARDRLRRAVAEHGRQAVFDELAERVDQRVADDRRGRAEEHLRRARGRERSGDLQGALHEVDQALALEPTIEAGSVLRDRVRVRLDDVEGERRQRAAIDEAGRDAERLLMVGELDRAEARLAAAVDDHGADPAFDTLASRIEAARRAKDAAQQGEWAERRQREAEAFVRSAAQRSMAGDFAAAVEQLEAAERLHVDLPELDERLATARRALDRQRREQAEVAARDAAIQQIRQRLDALHLDDAARVLDDAEARHGEGPHFTALRHRLDGLREAESAAGVLPTPADLPKLGIAARQAIRARETTVASAYGWLQVLLYPARGNGPQLILLLAFGSMGATLLHPIAGWIFLLLAFGMVGPALLRSTLDGANRPSALLWSDGGLGRDVRSLGRLLPVALVALLPTLVALVSRSWLPDLVVWLLVAVGLWLASALLVPTSAVAVAFADSVHWRFDRHLERLGEPAPHFVVELTFVVVTMLVLARATLVPNVPILGASVVVLLEAYAVLLLPHAIGTVVRGDRLAWAELYAR
ncbi:MAG: hypothetical protein AAGE94_04535 [Acidobacteriota bacterium]